MENFINDYPGAENGIRSAIAEELQQFHKRTRKIKSYFAVENSKIG